MFRGLCPRLGRALHSSSLKGDHILEQLRICPSEDQLFELVGKNKAKLSVGHVGCALGMLWDFQKEKPQILRTLEFVRSHPQFLTLRVLAENKISLMDDDTVVDMLYHVLRLSVEHHDSLVQQLVTEAWVRLERFQTSTLSKLAVCLGDQQLQSSPLMGQIADILSQRLDSIQDIRVLTNLMISVSTLVSSRLKTNLIDRVESLLDTMDPTLYHNPRRVLQFLRNIKCSHRPLLEKCDRIFLLNAGRMDAENVGIILGLYQSLQFSSCDFRLAAKQRLGDLLDSCADPLSFSKLFAALAPICGPSGRERLESEALVLADEFNAQQALSVAETLEEVQCRNLQLINKIASVLQKNLELFRPVEVARMTQALILLHHQNPELFTTLRNKLVGYLQLSVIPQEVTMLTRVLSMLPYPRLDRALVSHIEAVLPQCNLSELNSCAQAIGKWVRSEPTYWQGGHGAYVRLLQLLKHCGLERLRRASQLETLLDELKYVMGEWFEQMLLDETTQALERLAGQVSSSSAPEVAVFLTKANHLCTPLLDRIASVTVADVGKMHPTATYAILLPFAVLNYDPPNAEEFFSASIQAFSTHIGSFDPHLLVLLAYNLALADYFPEQLIKAIFTVEFLAKLDSQLETLPDALNMRIRLRLMELNRAVCLECPEFQVPWFHQRYCQQMQRKGNGTGPVQQQIHRMLGEVLGGINYARMAVVTPYSYTVDFECMLDRNMRPVPFAEPSRAVSEEERVQWGLNSQWKERNELPPGAQRIAVDFLDSRAFCRNSRHIKGEPIMRKRHLEILGYHVVQIPHFEWNSMEFSTVEAWKGYLRKKIFPESLV